MKRQAGHIHEQVIRSLREGAELRLQVIETCTDVIMGAADAVRKWLQHGGTVILFGNGGSGADAQHTPLLLLRSPD